MRQLKVLCLVALATLTIGIVNVASAFATELPSALFLSTETEGEAELSGESTTAKTRLTGITTLEGIGQLTSKWKMVQNGLVLGKTDILYTNVKRPPSKESCHSEGDPAGEVLEPGREWHYVQHILNIHWGTLILVGTESGAVKIVCGASFKLKVWGSQLLQAITALGKEVLTTENLELETGKCGGLEEKTPAFTSYNTDTGTAKAELKSSTALGTETSCQEVEGAIKLKPTKMFEVM